MKRVLLLVVGLVFTHGVCFAQFTGPSFWNTLPTSTMGVVNSTLVLTDNANGFVVSGQVTINLTGSSSGLLAHWVVDRPLDPTYNANNIFTTTVLDGYSLPAPGGALNSDGVVQSMFTDYLGTPVSLSSIPMTLVNGVDSPAWINLTATSALFNHTGQPGQFLRQWFYLDGVYTGGGGNWVIDVPVYTYIVPEPSTGALFAAAIGCLGGWCLRKRWRPTRRS